MKSSAETGLNIEFIVEISQLFCLQYLVISIICFWCFFIRFEYLPYHIILSWIKSVFSFLKSLE